MAENEEQILELSKLCLASSGLPGQGLCPCDSGLPIVSCTLPHSLEAGNVLHLLLFSLLKLSNDPVVRSSQLSVAFVL